MQGTVCSGVDAYEKINITPTPIKNVVQYTDNLTLYRVHLKSEEMSLKMWKQ